MSFRENERMVGLHDARAARKRDYPAVDVPHMGSSTEVRAGEGDIEGIRGWILVFGYLGGASSPHQLLVGRLDLRYPVKATLSHAVDGFDAGSGGAVFLPWPYVGLTLKDVSHEPAPESSDCSRAAISFFPVLAEDPAPPGLGSVLYGRHRVAVAPGGSEVEVPRGATEYRVLPATTLSKGKRFTVLERTDELEWAEYTIDPHQPLASAAALGHCAWSQTPLQEGARICLDHDDAGKRHMTVYWRYDLGLVR